jgi:hypothetical protein
MSKSRGETAIHDQWYAKLQARADAAVDDIGTVELYAALIRSHERQLATAPTRRAQDNLTKQLALLRVLALSWSI